MVFDIIHFYGSTSPIIIYLTCSFGFDVANASDDEDENNDDEMAAQVWALTQFYSVDFSLSRTSAFSTNAQSRFASVVVDGVLGPPRLARHT